jgi:integrase
MPRPATGSIREKRTARGTVFAIRFRASGRQRYVTLGTAEQGWTRARAEEELANVLADVRRGIWQEPKPKAVPEATVEPTFHEFASEWLWSRTPELKPATVQAYRNELSGHLLPFFAQHLVSQITVAEVDRYREFKLREGVIAGSYLNATITRLGAILDVADERDLIARNPVRVNPRRRKVKVSRSRRAYLDRPEQIQALLTAAGQLDTEAASRRDRDTCLRRPLIATLVFAGLRISEALTLRWRDVDLAGNRLRVDDAKTDAGSRWVPIAAALRSELVARKLSTRFSDVDDLVFTTIAGRKLSRDNTRTRILGKAIELADEALIVADLAPLPEKLTQHSLRHTYISLRVALGDDLAAVSRDAGHADINVTFRIYTHVMSLGEGDRARLRALVDGGVCAPLSSSASAGAVAADATSPLNDGNPHEQGVSGGSWGGTRTPDLTIMSRAL